jgi:hypothetical protein
MGRFNSYGPRSPDAYDPMEFDPNNNLDLLAQNDAEPISYSQDDLNNFFPSSQQNSPAAPKPAHIAPAAPIDPVNPVSPLPPAQPQSNDVLGDILKGYSDEDRQKALDDAHSRKQKLGWLEGIAQIGAAIGGRNPTSASEPFNKFRSDIDQETTGAFDANKKAALEKYALGRQIKQNELTDSQNTEENDPNSQSSKIAQQIAKGLGFKGDLAGLTAQKFKVYGPILEKMYAADSLKSLKLASAGSGKAVFNNLPKDKQETIIQLSKGNANKVAIANQIEAVTKNWDKLSPSQQLIQGRQLLKTLNSTQGADAIGAEEAKRLGSKLEYAFGNITNSNSTQFGRDLKGFKLDAIQTAKNLKDSISENQKIIDQAYGREPDTSNNDSAPQAPAVGEIQEGHKFKGGNPADPNNWEKI